jgi:HSP20 family protein
MSDVREFLYHEVLREGREWSPRADVYRTPTGWVVKLDLAGVRPEDVTIEVAGSLLQVRGVRRDTFVSLGYRHHSMEISYSRFQRSVRLPCSAVKSSFKTEYVQGMLVITVETEQEEHGQ